VSQRGSLSIEAALVIPTVLLVVLSMFELVALAATRFELTAAAREGARVAATVPDPGRAIEAVRETLGEPLGGEVRVTVTRPTVVGRLATVEIHVQRQLRSPFLDSVSVPLAVRAAMRVER